MSISAVQTRSTSIDSPVSRSRQRVPPGLSGERVFDDVFLDWLSRMEGFESLEVQAVPEGRVVHPNTPTAIVRGPLGIAQLVETSLLNHLNYPTLIATKASRVVDAAVLQVAGEGDVLADPSVCQGHVTAVGNQGWDLFLQLPPYCFLIPPEGVKIDTADQAQITAELSAKIAIIHRFNVNLASPQTIKSPLKNTGNQHPGISICHKNYGFYPILIEDI